MRGLALSSLQGQVSIFGENGITCYTILTMGVASATIPLKMSVKGGAVMAHMMKHTKASCGHMFAHFDRRAEHISNENLDRTRTHLNYNLAVGQVLDQGEFVKKRCAEVRCQNRKDVNVMVSWVVTAPKDLPEAEHKAFFQASYDFLQSRYGKENVVSAYVHMDEVTPHMHYAFVPVVRSTKRDRHGVAKEINKLSAKDCINRHDLQTFHGELQAYVTKELGHDVNILNEATAKGNRSITELKRQSATERLREATNKARNIVTEAQDEVQAMNDSLIAVKGEYEAKKAYVEEADKVSKVSQMYPEGVKVTEKGMLHKQKLVTAPADMWEALHVSAGERESLKKANEMLESNLEDMRKSSTSRYIKILQDRNNRLYEENESLRRELSKYKLEKTINQLSIDRKKEFTWRGSGSSKRELDL